MRELLAWVRTCSVPPGMFRFTLAKLLSPVPWVLPKVPRPAIQGGARSRPALPDSCSHQAS